MNIAATRVVRAVNRNWANSIRVAPAGWDALGRELDLWARRGRQAQFWWRDDDAADASAALQRLLRLRARYGLPLAIAAIPADATPGLAAMLAGDEEVRVIQHGWDHRNHAGPGRPKAELADGRDPDEVEADLRRGREKLAALFGERFLPVLVPPFNHLARSLSGSVAASGFDAVSTEGDFPGLALPCRNVHIDPIDWSRGAPKRPEDIIRQALGALRLRRFGLVSPSSPVGIVTHHLQHREETWNSLEALLQPLASHPAAGFAALETVFAR